MREYDSGEWVTARDAAGLQAEIERLREENDQIAQSAIDIVTVECERPEHKALNFGEWMEQGGGACSVCITEKLASAEQRAARAELLVRLLQCGEVIFNRATETVFTATEELPYDHTTWTDEQWERLEQLEREATDER
jgi:hypothetical protein